ncbi:MAG: ABC transporter ATP-binding protein [bacterium]
MSHLSRNPSPLLTVSSLVIRRSRSFTLAIPHFELLSGKITSLVGANGCGKTTFLEGLTGLVTPQGGEIRINGYVQDGRQIEAKRHVGYIPDDDSWIIPELTAAEYFKLLISLAPKEEEKTLEKRTTELSSLLDFNAIDMQTGALSHGNRKKVQIIAALMRRPKVLIVDELRNGLDPIVIRVAERLVQAEAQAGTAVLAATHDLWWAERFSDQVAILADGDIVLREKTARIQEEWGSLENCFLELCAGGIHE